MSSHSVDNNDVHVIGNDGVANWGYCNCLVNNQNQTMPSTNDTSDHNDDGFKCFASNGKPCQFPFQHMGKVTLYFWLLQGAQ